MRESLSSPPIIRRINPTTTTSFDICSAIWTPPAALLLPLIGTSETLRGQGVTCPTSGSHVTYIWESRDRTRPGLRLAVTRHISSKLMVPSSSMSNLANSAAISSSEASTPIFEHKAFISAASM